MRDKLLQISDLRVSFRRGRSAQQVIRGVTADIHRGQITGVLGESGSGKTVTFSSFLGLIDSETGQIDDGQAIFLGEDLLRMDERRLRAVRGSRISYVFQNPARAMNPYWTVGTQLTGLLQVHGQSPDKLRVLDTMSDVGLKDPEAVFDMYPFELSGGQNQRAMVALGIILNPDLLIADEPTSSVDMSLRKRILDLFVKINREHGTSIVIITHDFDVATYLCHDLIVMYGGLVMEEGRAEEILDNPLHPYTAELINCAHSLGSNDQILYSLPGTPLSPHEFRDECPFISRCAYARDACGAGIPAVVEADGRKVRCVR